MPAQLELRRSYKAKCRSSSSSCSGAAAAQQLFTALANSHLIAKRTFTNETSLRLSIHKHPPKPGIFARSTSTLRNLELLQDQQLSNQPPPGPGVSAATRTQTKTTHSLEDGAVQISDKCRSQPRSHAGLPWMKLAIPAHQNFLK